MGAGVPVTKPESCHEEDYCHLKTCWRTNQSASQPFRFYFQHTSGIHMLVGNSKYQFNNFLTRQQWVYVADCKHTMCAQYYDLFVLVGKNIFKCKKWYHLWGEKNIEKIVSVMKANFY
jgi:hypothetical protein